MLMIRYGKGTSFLHGLNPLSKLSVVVAYCIMIFLFDSAWFEAAVLVAILVTAYAMGVRQLVAFMFSPFTLSMSVMLFVMQLLFTPAGTPYFTIPLYFFNVPVTDMGVLKGIIMTLRFMTVILMSGLFVATTEPAQFVYSLMKAGVPYRYGFMVIMMLRFIPVFELEMNTVGNAQKMRGLEIDGGGVKGLIRSIRYTFVPLIISALSKVDCLVISMEGRAFGYKRTRTFIASDRYTLFDKALIVFCALVVIVLIADNIAGWYPLPHLNV
jgi:energy-coupling factor transport system permease protein